MQFIDEEMNMDFEFTCFNIFMGHHASIWIYGENFLHNIYFNSLCKTKARIKYNIKLGWVVT